MKYANFDVCRFFCFPTQIQGPVLVEDTCLCFNAFDELPGPYVYVCSLFRFDHLLNRFCEQSTYLCTYFLITSETGSGFSKL